MWGQVFAAGKVGGGAGRQRQRQRDRERGKNVGGDIQVGVGWAGDPNLNNLAVLQKRTKQTVFVFWKAFKLIFFFFFFLVNRSSPC